jgi:hypothetical protein
MKKCKGIWFYGFSGSGKSHISKILHKKIKNSVVLDGDIIRKYVSTDLNYSKEHRVIQLKRVFGISKIIIKSKKFPIISTAYFTNEINNKCKLNGILAIRVVRNNFEKIIKSHKTYKNLLNVVGKDIKFKNVKTYEIINDNSSNFIFKFKLFKDLNFFN